MKRFVPVSGHEREVDRLRDLPPWEAAERITVRRLALVFLGVGLAFAVDAYFRLSLVWRLWPLAVLALGIGLIGIFFKRKASGSWFLVVGIYLACFAGLALVCNFSTWKYLAHGWPLFILFFGATFVGLFFFHDRRRRILLCGLLLVSLGLLFLLVFAWGGQYWWIMFWLVGLSLFAAERVR